MSRVMPMTGALTAVMLAAAPGVLAQVRAGQDTTGSPWANVRPTPTVPSDTGALADSAYIRQAMAGNFTEVALGRLAESRAADSAVKEFARRMISEHNAMNQQWGTLARNNRMKTEVDFGPAGQDAIERLEDLSGAAFDQAYMREMIQAHQQDLAAYQRMSTSARSPDVRQLAQSGASTIRSHLALAQQVGSRVGVATTAARPGGVPVPLPAPAPSDTARPRTAADSARQDARDVQNDRRPLSAEDRMFVEAVLSDHLLQIRLAKRAQREAKRDETRRLAERIEKDFTEWLQRWQKVAARHDAEMDAHLERMDRRKIDRLEEASKGGVDRTYAAIVVQRLEALLQEFRRKGDEARSAGLRGLVEEELPVIRKDLALARRLHEQASQRAEALK